MPLEFWVAVEEGQYLQLDDVVEVATPLPDGTEIRLFGVVDLVRARHEGARFDSDVFLVERGVLPASVAHAAHVKVTRVEPEIFVPPRPGQAVRRATGLRRDQALFFDGMERKVPIGLSRDGEPVFANLDFLDGTRGRPRQHLRHLRRRHQDELRHVPPPQPLHERRPRGRGRQHPRPRLQREGRGPPLPRPAEREAEGRGPRRLREAGPAGRALRERAVPGPGAQGLRRAPARHREPRRGGHRPSSGRSARWCSERLLRFLFAEADDTASQLSFVVDRIEAKLAAAAAAKGEAKDAWIEIEGARIETFDELVEALADHPDGDESLAERWSRPAAAGTVAAFERRLHAAAKHVGHLIRGQGRGQARRARARLEAEAAQRRGHPRPARPGQALRGGRRPQAHVRGEGVARHRAAARLRRPRRAQQVRPARGERPDQGGAPRHLRARPQPRHRAHRRAADGLRGRAPDRGQRRAPGGRAASTPPRPSGPSTAS